MTVVTLGNLSDADEGRLTAPRFAGTTAEAGERQAAKTWDGRKSKDCHEGCKSFAGEGRGRRSFFLCPSDEFASFFV